MDWKPGYRRHSWDELLAEWHAGCLDRGLREWTIAQYVPEAGRFAAWAIGEGVGNPAEVSPAHVRAYARLLRTDRGLGPRSIASRLTAIRSMFDHAVMVEAVHANPAKAVRNPKFRKPLPKLLTTDEVKVLLELPTRRGDGLIPRRDAAIISTLLYTGVRVSELTALDWDHLNLTAGEGSARIVDGKGGKDRVIPLVEPAIRRLLSYLELRLPLGADRWVFHSFHGGRLHYRSVRDRLVIYGARIGRADIHPHLLRAQCATELIRVGASLPEVRSVLGHAGYDTLVPYTVLAAEDAKGSLDRLAQRIEGVGQA